MLALTAAYLLPILALAFMSAMLWFGNLSKRQGVKHFLLFLTSLIVWLSLLWMADAINSVDTSPILLNIALVTGSFSPWLFFLFAQSFVRKRNNIINYLIFALACFFAVTSAAGLLIKEVDPGQVGILITEASSLYLGQSIYTILVFTLSVLWIVLPSRRDLKGRNQSLMISLGAISALVVGIFGGVVISEASGSNLLSPLSVTLFSAGAFIAIFKHGLFDIRLIIVRSITYLLLISSMVAIYTVVVFGIATRLFSDNSVLAQKIIPIVAAIALSITAPYLKKAFDRLTNKIFYRDAYDPEVFLDQLNKTIVGNIEIGILLRHTTQVIQENIKAECHIYVCETETTPPRIIGTSPKNIKEDILKLIDTEMMTIKNKTVVADDLERHYSGLQEALLRNEIAVISSLVTSYSANREATAYLILGPKKSGGPYSKQDIRIINIISDELLIAIQNALRFEEIQDFNVTLQNRISDATAKLKRSNDKLKEMDETKDEFISMASHQLRTPLTSVKGYLSMVLDGDAGKITETQRELLNQAFVSSQRMVYMIADLLNVSRLKTGKFIIDKTPTNLIDMIESEIAQLTEVAKSKNLDLSFDKPDDLPPLMLDETKTRQVVMNFVDNAIYYTPNGGKIKIEVRTDRSSIYFLVKDNGIGVPKADQSHLFGKFYRAKNAREARPDGTGLGLFMAKKVITEQGGTILFESTQGKGSTFGFKFDKSSAAVSEK